MREEEIIIGQSAFRNVSLEVEKGETGPFWALEGE